MTTYLFTLTCPDQPGIVSAVSTALHTAGANILTNHQFTDPVSNIFVMRTRFVLVDHADSFVLAGPSPLRFESRQSVLSDRQAGSETPMLLRLCKARL